MTSESVKFIDVAAVRKWLAGDGEIAFLDVREEGSMARGIRCYQSTCPTAGSNSMSVAWCRGIPAASFSSMTATG